MQKKLGLFSSRRAYHEEHLQLLSERLRAEHARWFSSDLDMLVYFTLDGRAIPVTRDEQDRLIADAGTLADEYVEMERYHRHNIFLLTRSYLSYKRKCRALREKAEQRFLLRPAVPHAKAIRRNIFSVIHMRLLFAIGLCIAAMIIASLLGFEEVTSALIELFFILYVPMAISHGLGQKVDKKHLEKTGKWYRIWR
jgi:hypothetical protein